MALYAGNDQVILPVSARQIDEKLMLTYVNGAEAIIEVGEKEEYLTFKLISLTNRGKTDHVVWGPYYTTIREYIGDLLGVVSNERCTIGMVACITEYIHQIRSNILCRIRYMRGSDCV